MRKIFWIPAVIVGLFAGWVVAGAPNPNLIDVHPQPSSFPWLRSIGDQETRGDAGVFGNVSVGGNLTVTGNTVSSGSTTANGSKQMGLMLDGGFLLSENVDGGLNSLVSEANGLCQLDGFGDLACQDAGFAGGTLLGSGTSGAILAQIGSGTAETNAILPVTFFDQAAPVQEFAVECFADAGVSNAVQGALHFQNVGATAPLCFCSDINAAAKSCNPTAVTATNVAVIGSGGTTDKLQICCIGPK